jgi:hypothetical protein
LDFAGALLLGGDPELLELKDAGARMADVANAAVIANGLQATGRWLAFRLEDGRSDGVIYDTRPDAITHAKAPCHYEQLRPRGYGTDECAMTLAYARALHASMGAADLDMPAPILPVRLEDRAAKRRQLARHAQRRARRINRR